MSFLIHHSAVIVGQLKFGPWLGLIRHRSCKAFVSSAWLGVSCVLGWDLLWADCLMSVIFSVASHEVSGSVSLVGGWAGWSWEFLVLEIQVIPGGCMCLWILFKVCVCFEAWAGAPWYAEYHLSNKKSLSFVLNGVRDRQRRSNRCVPCRDLLGISPSSCSQQSHLPK